MVILHSSKDRYPKVEGIQNDHGYNTWTMKLIILSSWRAVIHDETSRWKYIDITIVKENLPMCPMNYIDLSCPIKRSMYILRSKIDTLQCGWGFLSYKF